MNTLNESQIISLLPEENPPDVDVLARRICGQTVFIGWPHLIEARVVAVANKQVKYSLEMNVSCEGVSKGDNSISKVQSTARETEDWHATERDIKIRYLFSALACSNHSFKHYLYIIYTYVWHHIHTSRYMAFIIYLYIIMYFLEQRTILKCTTQTIDLIDLLNCVR